MMFVVFKNRLQQIKVRKHAKAEVEKSPSRTDRKTYLRTRSDSSNQVQFSAKDRTHTVMNLMSAQKNPSAVFKPPFGINVDEHHTRLGEHAKYLWKCNKITDLIVKLNGVQYPCHKTVLSCYSKYFKNFLLEAKGTVSVINLRLPAVSNTAFEVLLTYMYTSELILTCQNIGEVYTAARKLGMDGALILCTRVLTGQSKYEVHSVYVYVTAKKQQLDDCAAKALKIMTRRFEQIVGTPEFLDLDFLQVKEYLSQNVLATRSEVIVYLAALKWLSVRYLEREQFATDLLGCVRFQMMNLNEVLACFSPPLLPGILELQKVKDSLLEATCYVAAMTVNEEKRFDRYACKPRKYLLPRETIIIWDPSIFDPERHAMYMEEMAATTIQAAYRGYKARQSIAEDISSGKIKAAASRSFSMLMNLSKLDEFEPPKNGDETYIQNVPSNSSSDSKYSFIGNIRKSVVTFMRGDKDSNENLQRSHTRKLKHQDKKPKRDTSPPRFESGPSRSSSTDTLRSNIRKLKHQDKKPKRDTSPPGYESGPSRSNSTDTLVGHVNQLAQNTEIKKYVSDTVVDISSETFHKSFSQPPEIVHKSYTHPNTKREEEQNLDLNQSVSSNSVEGQTSTEKQKGYIIVTGGFRSGISKDDLEGKSMFLFDTEKEKWKMLGSMEKARHHHCMAYLDAAIYLIGGCNPDKTKAGRMVPEKTCYQLTVSSWKWRKIAKMHHCRMYHGIAELNDRIYAVGGKNEKDRMLSSVEEYNPNSNKWDELDSDLDVPIMGIGACSHQGKLWVVGGMVQDEEGNITIIDEVKCYDPKRQRWSKSRKLPQPRAFVTAVSFENHLYVIGGTSQLQEAQVDQLTSVPDVLYFDEEENRWNISDFLPFPRHFVESAVIGKDLYVLGGLTSYQKTAVDEVLVYDQKLKKWQSSKPVPMPLCGFAAVAVPETVLQ